MTQHPFDREYPKQDSQKLNSSITSPNNEDELTNEEAEDVAGGVLSIPSVPRFEEEIGSPPPSCPVTEAGVWEGGGRFLAD